MLFDVVDFDIDIVVVDFDILRFPFFDGNVPRLLFFNNLLKAR